MSDGWKDGWMGWDGMVIIGLRSSKSTFGAYNHDANDDNVVCSRGEQANVQNTPSTLKRERILRN